LCVNSQEVGAAESANVERSRLLIMASPPIGHAFTKGADLVNEHIAGCLSKPTMQAIPD
jgi:hypothetical protein